VPLRVDVRAEGVGRYPGEVEAAVYFSCLEALQNAVKYADAREVVVGLADRGRSLTFEVIDDGRGFDASVRTYGTGLQGIADRLDAIDGTLTIRSEPVRGTTVSGSVPITSGAAAAAAREPA
jgi:signal transduction histidine kinase